MIPWIALNESHEEENAQSILETVNRNSDRNEWPAPIVPYLLGKLDEEELLASKKGTPQEIHFYIGMNARVVTKKPAMNHRLLIVTGLQSS